MRATEQIIGTERCTGAYAFKSMRENGAVLAFGSDRPGKPGDENPLNPLYGLYAAVTRKTLNGEPAGGWFPSERLSIEDAIRAYTLGSAYATFEDDIKGSITVGKLVDMTVLSQNLIEIDPVKIPETQVVYTIVGGKIVYQKAER